MHTAKPGFYKKGTFQRGGGCNTATLCSSCPVSPGPPPWPEGHEAKAGAQRQISLMIV